MFLIKVLLKISHAPRIGTQKITFYSFRKIAIGSKAFIKNMYLDA